MSKVAISIQRIKCHSDFLSKYDGIYHVMYSGGKDSDVIRLLCKMAEVPYRLVYYLTSVEFPETLEYIKNLEEDVVVKSRSIDMYKLIIKNGLPPILSNRYCCDYFKNYDLDDKFLMTGIRWVESKPTSSISICQNNRLSDRVQLISDNTKHRMMLETCTTKNCRILNPILDWTDNDVWEFLKANNCKSNPAYSRGLDRVGCIGCCYDNSDSRKKLFDTYPEYRDKLIEALSESIIENKLNWSSSEELFEWWTR